MCGIAGSITPFLQLDLSSSIAHRGPDSHGVFNDDWIKLEHRRLSIIDLSENANQPMISDDGNYVLIFNGEIYNHLNIRKKLISRGYKFNSSSDTESLLYGYIEYGPKILEDLNGIFAFALYDKLKRQLFLARDHFGVKPLYYYQKENVFLFSSEIKSFLNYKEFDRAIDYGALFNYLQYLYCPGDITPFKKVKRLDPGCYMIIQLTKDNFSINPPVQFYQVPFTGNYTYTTENETLEVLDIAFTKAVNSQLLSDVPVGFFLSGGLDSSLITAVASKILGYSDINCFTIASGKDLVKEGFSDDLFYAKKVAKQLNCKLNIIEAEPQILKDFDKTIWHLDEPQADPAAIHILNISKGARQCGIKVLLGGTAGDDIFSGYRRHQALRYENLIEKVPLLFKRGFEIGIQHIRSQHPLVRRAKRISHTLSLTPEQRLAAHFTWAPSQTIYRLFNPEIAEQIDFDLVSTTHFLNALRKIPNEKSPLNQMLFLEMKTFLVNHNLNYTDKMSMAEGIEARVPFLDVDLVNLSTKISPDLKLRDGTTKYILKKVAEKYLSKDVIYRSKSGFAAPVRKWIQHDMVSIIKERLSENEIKRRGIFSYPRIKKLIDDNQNMKSDNAYQILSLLAIDSWIRQFCD